MPAPTYEGPQLDLINLTFPWLQIEAPKEDYTSKSAVEIALEFNQATDDALDGLDIEAGTIRVVHDHTSDVLGSDVLAVQVNTDPDAGLGKFNLPPRRVVRHLEIISPLVNTLTEDDLEESVAFWSNTTVREAGDEGGRAQASVGISWKYDSVRRVGTPPKAYLFGVSEGRGKYKVEQEVGAERDQARINRAFGVAVQIVQQLSSLGLRAVEFEPKYHNFGRGGVDNIPGDLRVN